MRRGGSRTECVGDHHDATVILDADDARAGHDGVRGALHPPELRQSKGCCSKEACFVELVKTNFVKSIFDGSHLWTGAAFFACARKAS